MDDLIQRARKALVDVAPGPWEAALEKGCHGIVASIQDEVRCVAIIGNAPETPEREPMRFANAGFIAAARDLVPAMADRLEAQESLLRSERDRFEAALGRACQVGGTTYLVERAEKAEAERDRLRAALTIYAQSGNWRLGGCCDPNSPNFTGEAIARAALKGDSDV